MLPCTTNGSYWHQRRCKRFGIQDIPCLVVEGLEVRLVSNRWFLANGLVVPSTRLSKGLYSRLVEPYGYDHPLVSASEGARRPVTCASFVMVKCHASFVEQGKRLAMGTLVGQEQAGFSDYKFATFEHLCLTANDCDTHLDAAMLVSRYSHMGMASLSDM